MPRFDGTGPLGLGPGVGGRGLGPCRYFYGYGSATPWTPWRAWFRPWFGFGRGMGWRWRRGWGWRRFGWW